MRQDYVIFPRVLSCLSTSFPWWPERRCDRGAECHTIPAQLLDVVHRLRQGDALGLRQKHHEAAAHGGQDTCGQGKVSPPGRTPPAPLGEATGKQRAHRLHWPGLRPPLTLTSSAALLCHDFPTPRPVQSPCPCSWRAFLRSRTEQLLIEHLLSAKASEKPHLLLRGKQKPTERSPSGPVPDTRASLLPVPTFLLPPGATAGPSPRVLPRLLPVVANPPPAPCASGSRWKHTQTFPRSGSS